MKWRSMGQREGSLDALRGIKSPGSLAFRSERCWLCPASQRQWGPRGDARANHSPARVSRLDGAQSKPEISLMAGPARSECTVLSSYHYYGVMKTFYYLVSAIKKKKTFRVQS